jgi:sec-independent protein translocase protein TatA
MGLDNPLHIAFLVVILLLVFGARRLPEIGRSLGSGMREFKDSVTGESKQAALPPAPEAQQPAAPAAAQPAAAPAAAQPAVAEVAPARADASGPEAPSS